MKFPKPVMSISELVKMGFSRTDLYKMAHSDDAHKYVLKMGGKILFDTERLSKELKNAFVGQH